MLGNKVTMVGDAPLVADVWGGVRFLTDKYLDRQFDEPLTVDEKGRPLKTDGEGNAVAVTAVKTAKFIGWAQYKDDRGKNWKDNSPPGRKPYTWQNKTAYELALALERVGFMAFRGYLPLGLFFPWTADRIVVDWVLCHPWVDGFRKGGKTSLYVTKSALDLCYQRRHAEWVALAAGRYMAKLAPLYDGREFFDEICAGEGGVVPAFEQCHAALRKYEPDGVPASVQAEIDELFGGMLKSGESGLAAGGVGPAGM